MDGAAAGAERYPVHARVRDERQQDPPWLPPSRAVLLLVLALLLDVASLVALGGHSLLTLARAVRRRFG
jgi:hypothetical protein